MQKLSSLLFATLISISIIALAHESMAQTSAAPSKAGTRLITLGTSGGPNPRAHRAQSSNLLIVNGALYVIDAGDGVSRRLAKAASTFERSELFLSPTIMTITRRVSAR